jgi:hypothetical protein
MISFKEIVGEQPFYWTTPRTKESLTSKRVRFTKREFDPVLKPRLWIYNPFKR